MSSNPWRKQSSLLAYHQQNKIRPCGGGFYFAGCLELEPFSSLPCNAILVILNITKRRIKSELII